MNSMLCASLIYNMGDKIRRLSMYVVFKYIWLRLWDEENGASNKLKELNMLN